jgi:hypothetical protein
MIMRLPDATISGVYGAAGGSDGGVWVDGALEVQGNVPEPLRVLLER